MDGDMKGVVVLTMSVAAMVALMAAEQGVVDIAMAAEWGLWMQRWWLVVGAEVVVLMMSVAAMVALMAVEQGVVDTAMAAEWGLWMQ